MAIRPAGTSWNARGILQTLKPDLICKLIPTIFVRQVKSKNNAVSMGRRQLEGNRGYFKYSRLIKYDSMTPTATMIWNRPVIRPRTSFGEHSETKAGATAEIAPIPTPAMTLPA